MRPTSIIRTDESENVLLQLGITAPRAARQTFPLEHTEPNLDLIQPRRMRRQKVPHDPSGVFLHPCVRLGRGARFQIVADEMQHPICRNGQHAIQIIQKLNELNRSMPCLTTSIDPTGPHVQGGEHIQGPVAHTLRVKFLSGDPPRPHGPCAHPTF